MSREISIDWSMSAMLRSHRRGPGDPSYRIDGAEHRRGIRTPDGPAALAFAQQGPRVSVRAWGPGADWALESAPRLLGLHDQPETFTTTDPMIGRLLATHGSPRFGASGLVIEALVPAVLEQKVIGQEAFASFRALLRRYGAPAPGPFTDLRCQPSAETIAAIPSWEWLQLGVDPARSKALVPAMKRASALSRLAERGAEEFTRGLISLPGIGRWTAAEVCQRAFGDPDAVSFGDYHVAKDIGWAVTGQPWDDDELASYLEPFRPHRARVVSLIYRAAGHRPRRGARLSLRTHLPT